MDLIDVVEYLKWVVAALAFLVSLLTLTNAFRLRSGVLAVSTYSAGAGMLFIAAGLFLLNVPVWASLEVMTLTNYVLFFLGFILLGVGSFKIYRMSQV